MGETTHNTIRAHKKRLLFDMDQQRCTPPRAAISPFAKGPAVCPPYLGNILEGGADLVFQIGTAKYGVRDALVGVIAHSCGVREPRQLRRFHARIVTENRHSVSLEELYAAQSAQNDNTRQS